MDNGHKNNSVSSQRRDISSILARREKQRNDAIHQLTNTHLYQLPLVKPNQTEDKKEKKMRFVTEFE